MVHGLDSAGARYQRPGFAWTAEQDLSWALGWPHVIELASDDEDPAARAFAILAGASAPRMSRDTANRVLRLLATTVEKEPTAEHRTAAATVEAPTERDLRATVKRQLAGVRAWGSALDWLFVLEAVTSPERALELLLDDLEKRSRRALEKADVKVFLPAILHSVGYVLLRVHREAEPVFRERLGKLRDQFAEWAGGKYDWSGVVRKLGLVLDGAAAVRRENADGILSLRDHEFAYDDPALVDEAATRFVPKQWTPEPVVRLCFLGTEKVLESYATRWQKLDKQEAFFREISAIQSPIVIEILAEMATKSKVKKLAAAWFATHPERKPRKPQRRA